MKSIKPTFHFRSSTANISRPRTWEFSSVMSAAALCMISSAMAANETWNATTNTTWDTTTANWTGPSTIFTNGDNAIFSSSTAGSTLALGSSLTVGNIFSNGAVNTPPTTTISSGAFNLTLGSGTAGSGNIYDLAGAATGYAQNLTYSITGGTQSFLMAAGSGTVATPSIWNVATGKVMIVQFAPTSSATLAGTADLGGNVINLTGAGSVQFNSGGAVAAAVGNGLTVQNGTFNVASGSSLQFAGGSTRNTIVNNTVTVNVASGGSLLLAANTGTGSAFNQITNLNGGTISFGGGASNNVATINLGAATTSTLIGTGPASLATLSGTGGLTFNNSGGITVTGANSGFSGAMSIAQGTVRVANNDTALGSGAITFTSSATLATANGGGVRYVANPITINATRTASFDGGFADLNLAGPISGAGALTKASTGNLILSGTNNYAGATTVSAGNLWVMNAAAVAPATTITVNSNASLVATGAQPTVMGWLNSGKLATTSAGSIALNNNSSEVINFSTGGFNTLGLTSVKDVTFSGTITPGTNGYLFGNTGSGNGNSVEGNLNVSTGLTGAFGLTKSGNSVLTLSGANSYTGATLVNAGTVLVTGSIANTGGITVPGGTLALVGSGSITGSGTVSVGAGNLATYSVNAIGGAGSTIDLTNGTTGLIYTGAGETTDRVIRYNSLAAGGFITSVGTGTVNFTAPATTTATSAFGVTFTGAGSGSFVGVTQPATHVLINFNKQGTGKWTITGNSDLNAGNLRSDGGVLQLASTYTSASGAAAMSMTRSIANGGVLKIASGASAITSTVNTNGILGGWATFNDNTWVVTNGNATAVSGLATYDTTNAFVAGANEDVTASFTAGAGAAANSLRFNTAAASTVTLNGANVLTSGGILVTSAVGANTTTITGGTSIATGITNGDMIIHQNNTAAPLTINAVIAANGLAGGLTKAGSGTLNLGGINTYTGTTFVDEGTLNLTVGGSAGAIRGNLTIAQGATVNVNAANGLGNTQNTRVGTIAINGGTLNFGTTGANSATSVGISFTGGSLTGVAGSLFDLRNNGNGDTNISTTASQTTATVSVGTLGTAGGSTTFNTAKGYTASGIDLLVTSNIVNDATGIGGGGGNVHSLTKLGLGTAKLTGTNTYTGNTFVGNGTLEVGSTGATNGKATLTGGKLVVTNGIIYNIDGGLTFASNQNAIVSAASGAATLRSFDVNSADVIVNAGVVGTIDSTLGVSTAGGFGFRADTTGDLTIEGVISGAGSANNAIGMTGQYVGTDSGAFYKLGAGTLTLTGASTFTAGASVAATTVQNGVLKLSGGNDRLPATSAVYLGVGTTSGKLVLDGISQTVTGLKNVGTGTGNAVVGGSITTSTLTVNNTNNYTFGGTLGGTGTNENNLALTKSGSGVLTLTGTSTYTGSTTVNGGSLLVNGNIAGSSLTLNAGGLLGGSGTVGALTMAGGTISPGNSPGLLTTGSVTTSSSASTFSFEIGGLAAGTQYDRISTVGTLGLGGTLVVSLTNGYVPISGDTFNIWLNDGTDAIGGIFAGLADGTSFAAPETGGSWNISYASNGDAGSTGNDISLVYSAVPEPAAILLLSLPAMAMLRRRRHELKRC